MLKRRSLPDADRVKADRQRSGVMALWTALAINFPLRLGILSTCIQGLYQPELLTATVWSLPCPLSPCPLSACRFARKVLEGALAIFPPISVALHPESVLLGSASRLR